MAAGVLNITRNFVRGALGLIQLALGLAFFVASHFADSVFDATLRLFVCPFDMFLIDSQLLSSS